MNEDRVFLHYFIVVSHFILSLGKGFEHLAVITLYVHLKSKCFVFRLVSCFERSKKCMMEGNNNNHQESCYVIYV